MSEQSNNRGRAYEFICIMVLQEEISKIRQAKVVENTAYNAALHAWKAMPEGFQYILRESAGAAVSAIFEMEPMILEPGSDMLELKIQTDSKGKEGDVRDIVISRSDVQWEIGLSIKHNHFAVKHSRLANNSIGTILNQSLNIWKKKRRLKGIGMSYLLKIRMYISLYYRHS